MLTTEEIKAILKPQFGLLGKGGEFKAEPLWVHAFTLWSIVSKIIKFIPRFDGKERRLLEITVLIHDIGKMTGKNQAILSGHDGGEVRHTQTKEQIKAYFEAHGMIEQFGLLESDVDFIYHAHLHHDLPEEALKTAPPSLAIYADIVRYADWLASQERVVDGQLIRRISNSLEPFCQITLVNVSRPDGPSNYLLFDTAYNIYKELGWDVLIVFSNSLLLIAPKNTPYPAKNEIVQNFQNRRIRETLLLQKPVIRNFTKKFLGGESAKNPKLYLEVHKEDIIEALGDFEKAPLLFFKLLIEIIDISGELTPKIRREFPVLDILKGLSSTNLSKARQKWIDLDGKITESLKGMLKEMFDCFPLNKVVPHFKIFNMEDAAKILKQISPDELYNILYKLAEKLFPDKADMAFQNALDSLISMEEEANFRKIAIERFEKYKEYKSTQNPEKGICESCGFIIAFSAQKSLSFPSGKEEGFSQISARTNSKRAVCSLCVYDVMLARKDIPESKNPIYVRIESKDVGLWLLYDDICKLIQNLDSSLSNPYELENLNENSGYGFLPVPKTFKMPKFRKEEILSQSLKSIRGYVIPISRPVNNSISSKDLRAKYLSLYALLKMMGFDAHIGFEEQNGLFGDNPIAKHGEDYESLYYRGLAVKYLANLLGGEKKKKQNAHVLAESILIKKPSVALIKIGEVVDDKKRKNKPNTEQIRYIIEAIVKGEFTLKRIKNGGEYTMKELLQDAAFFADKENGIGHFCIEPEKRRDFWNPMNMTRYNTAKPVSDALDEIMQGRELDMAMERFMRNIAKKIGQEEQDKLTDFVKRARNIFVKYHNLRQEDISEFIKAKSALTSSIFILTRYEKLNIKEVVNG